MIVTRKHYTHHLRGAGIAATALLLAVIVLTFAAASASAAIAPQLFRYPYLTDAVGTSTAVNWATDRSGSIASVRWGPAGSTCDAAQADATRVSIKVNNVQEYQWTATMTGLTPDAPYCYRVLLGGIDLLGTDASPQFTAPPAPFSTNYQFAVFGDTGRVDSVGNNPDQQNLMARIATSGARFALMTGDMPYVPSGLSAETAYGDLSFSGSAIFGSKFWAVPGRSIPFFPALGNHGLSTSFLSNWPQARAVAESGGRYQMDAYSGAHNTNPASYPSGWYAMDVGNARIYVLDSAWANSNKGTASHPYEADYDYHWNAGRTGCTPECGLQYDWLKNDLESHPSQLKFVVSHYPLYSDNKSETSDTYLRADGPAGSNSLESLLSANGVDLLFNGHAHVYQRNVKQNGIVTYVSGAGGAETQPVDYCSPFDAYAIGFSSRGGTSCNAPPPTSAAQVAHFLLVSVSGTTVTVTPTDSTGRTFDAKTYSFAETPDTTPPSTPTGVTVTTKTKTSISLSWNASTDDIGVVDYLVSRNGAAAISTGGARTFTATGLTCGTSHQFRVYARDLAGNTSAPSATLQTSTASCLFPPPPPPPDTTPPSTPTGVTVTGQAQTSISLAWNASTDNVAVTSYAVSRNGAAAISTGSARTFTATGLTCGTSHSFTVVARDAAGNTSAPSAALQTTTSACPPPPGGVAFVRQATGSVSAGTIFDVPIVSTTGNTLVASIAIKAGSTVSVSTVSDLSGGTWTKGPIGFFAGSSTRVELWYRTAGPAVTAVSVKLSALSDSAANVSEWSGVAPSNPLDAQAGAGNAASTSAPTPLLTTTARDVVIGAVNWTGATSSALSGTTFTALDSYSVTGTVNGRAAYALPVGAGSFQATWGLSSSRASGGAILALKAAG